MATIRSLSSKEVAGPMNLAAATIQKYARDGRIPFSSTPGGHRRFNLDEVRSALSEDYTERAMRPPLPLGGSLTTIYSAGRSDTLQPHPDEALRATITPAEESTVEPEDAVNSLFRHARRVLVAH